MVKAKAMMVAAEARPVEKTMEMERGTVMGITTTAQILMKKTTVPHIMNIVVTVVRVTREATVMVMVMEWGTVALIKTVTVVKTQTSQKKTRLADQSRDTCPTRSINES
jgi:hypothetical protein